MPDRPWDKWYFGDWQSDPKVGMCSLAARGLWVEMLAIMHFANPRGHLLVNGQVPTDAQLAALARAPADQIPTLVDELESAGVFSRTRAGVIYSRRMTKKEKHRKDGAKSAKEGRLPGSRRSKQAAENKENSKPPPGVAGRVVDQPPSTQRLEARDKTITGPPPSSDRRDPGSGGGLVAKRFIELRSQHFPNESRLPAPTLTIEAEAASLLGDGGTPELLIEVLGRQMARTVARGGNAPRSLAAYHLSLEDEIRKFEAGANVGTGGARAGFSPAGEDPPDVKAGKERLAARGLPS